MYEFIHYQVRDFMIPEPITVRPDVKVKEAEEIFEDHDFNGLPVVNKESVLLGIITKLDIMNAFEFDSNSMIPMYKEIMEKKISDVMSTDIFATEPEMPLTRVLSKMIETRHKSFPVVNELNRVVGIIAREDILKALRAASKGKRPSRLAQADA